MTGTQGNQTTSQVSRSSLSVLFSVVFLDNLGFAIVLPYLYYYAQSLGGSDFVYGLLLASYSLMSFAFTPVVARLSDRFGRRNILLVSLAASSFSYFLFGTAQALWLLFVARMLAGTTAATVPVAQAYVADVTTDRDRLKYLGFLGAAASLAFILGPAVGGALGDLYGYAMPSFLASGLALANLISAYLRLPEPIRAQGDGQGRAFTFGTLKDVLRKRQMALLLTVYFLVFTSFLFLQTALPPWLQRLFGFGSLETGLIFFFVGAVVTFTQAVLLPRLSRKVTRINLVLIGTAVLAAGLWALSFSQNLVLMLGMAALISFGFGAQLITINALISVSAPKEAQGGTLGVAQSLVALAQTISPVAATTIFVFGTSVGAAGLVFMVSGTITLATVPLALNLRKTVKE